MACIMPPRPRLRLPEPTPGAPAPDAGLPTPPAEDKETIPRLTIPLTADGAPLWDRMRSETKDKVKTFLRDHGTPVDASQAPAETFDPLVVHALYEALGALSVLSAVALGHTRESSEVMRFSLEEKQRLTPYTQRVLAKYGASIAKYQDEAALGLVPITTYQAKAASLVPRTRPTGVVQPFPSAIEPIAIHPPIVPEPVG